MFRLDHNITKINFYLYLYNNEIYNDDKMEYLKKYYLITKNQINKLTCFHIKYELL